MRIGWPVGPAGCMILLTKKKKKRVVPVSAVPSQSSHRLVQVSKSLLHLHLKYYLTTHHDACIGHGRRVKKTQKKKRRKERICFAPILPFLPICISVGEIDVKYSGFIWQSMNYSKT